MTYRHSFTKDPRWDRLMDSLAERALLLAARDEMVAFIDLQGEAAGG